VLKEGGQIPGDGFVCHPSKPSSYAASFDRLILLHRDVNVARAQLESQSRRTLVTVADPPRLTLLTGS
jgi:hypothetical protein